ncbi:hypothetical protein N7516_008336 [Penicillium verrucosum]|uniref:uncharacterized protein n=1 Tax=Penicillium verrucosum TaxID=60171 RepID=UPI0025455C69|nr:uncharacterized protein N7516_008336 [Penicillium verrucosum]KAJ5926563.1 hypothetical protein N7516_008336 [Penicillium verrucosum]
MSLGSLAGWQSTLFSALSFTNLISYLQTDIQINVVISILLSSAIFFNFEYTDGSVIAALAVLETPTSINASNPQQVDISKVDKVEDDHVDQSDVTSRDRSEDARQLLSSLRQTLLCDIIPCLGAGLFMCAGLYLISLFGFIGPDLNKTHAMSTFVVSGHLTMKTIFSITPSSNAVTNQRSLARQHLRSQKGFRSIYPGLNVFLIYNLVTVLITILARPIFAEGHNLFVTMFFRLSFGLLLTNLHTAWVHAVISKPSKKSMWQRLPGWREWIAIIPAASLDIVLPHCVYHLTKRFGVSIGYQAFGEAHFSQENLGSLAFLIIAVVFEYFASIFTRATYIRVAASMLPNDDESVVPFDRSFGGRVGNNETHCLTIIDAFRTMALLNWYRYLKIVWEVLYYEHIGIVFSGIAIAIQTTFWV